MFTGGRIATCAIVDLEVLRFARNTTEHEEIWLERQLLPRAPVTETATDRAMDVQGELCARGLHRRVPLTDLIIAASAEQQGLTVLHYDRDYDVIAEVTGQPMEWVVPRGTVP